LDAVHLRQHPVDEQDVELLLLHLRERLLAVIDDVRLVLMVDEGLLEDESAALVVVDYEYAHGPGSLPYLADWLEAAARSFSRRGAMSRSASRMSSGASAGRCRSVKYSRLSPRASPSAGEG